MFLPFIPNQKAKIGFYFHVPFCSHICPYCDFTKTSRFSKKDVNAYFQEISRSLNQLLEQFDDSPYIRDSTHCTVYFGGGTPGLFDAKFYAPLLKRLSKNFIFEEVTIETNPFSNKQNFISGYRDIGIDRITLGAQSLCENTLKILGRKHTKETILKNIEWLRAEGMNQIQVDLIYGLKTNRSIPIQEEIKTLISAGATGISAYGLTIESRTVFAQSAHPITDEEKSLQEYESILNACAELGLRQIETSNFSFFDANHNQLYWYGYPYFGIGTGAHGLLPPVASASRDATVSSRSATMSSRSATVSSRSATVSSRGLTAGSTNDFPYGARYKIGTPAAEHSPGNDILKFNTISDIDQNFKFIFEPQRTRANMIEELIFTLLRTEHGIPVEWLVSVFNDPQILESKIISNPKIKRALQEGKIKMTATHISLSPPEKIRGDSWAVLFITCLV